MGITVFGESLTTTEKEELSVVDSNQPGQKRKKTMLRTRDTERMKSVCSCVDADERRRWIQKEREREREAKSATN